ncbi:MAG: hypothetical protein WHS90_12860 [Caldilinea sp.]|uniref:hypothetical protein n=1 Tax=Caldilinea sp. TaxID=2293560 RepID=UPI0030AA3053
MLRSLVHTITLFLAVIGLLLCLAALIGVWAVRKPVTDATVAVLRTFAQEAAYAGAAGGALSEQITRADAVMETVRERLGKTVNGGAPEIQEMIRSRVAPSIASARSTLINVRTSLVALNASLEQLNRLPGVEAPTFTAELQEFDRHLTEFDALVTELQTLTAESTLDVSQIEASIERASRTLMGLRARVDAWSAQIEQVRAWSEESARTAPFAIDLVSVLVSLLAILFGAGQLCLIRRIP